MSTKKATFYVETRIDGAEGATMRIEPANVRGGLLAIVRPKYRHEAVEIPLADLIEIAVERHAKMKARMGL